MPEQKPTRILVTCPYCNQTIIAKAKEKPKPWSWGALLNKVRKGASK